jgi:hypothetical protein
VDEQQWLTVDLFVDRVGEEFVVSAEGGPSVAMTLSHALEGSAPGGVGPDGQERQQFSLWFRGPLEPLLRQATYDVEHAELGRLALFLVPLGRDDGGTRYEAAFA